MKRTIRLPIVVVLSLALAMSAVAPAVTLAQEGTSPACAAAYAALARYYAGEITKAEADAAVALCEAESQDPPGDGQGGGSPPGDGQGGGGQGGGGQGQPPQNHDEFGAPTGSSPGSSGQGQGPRDPEPNRVAVAVTGHEYHEEYRKNQQYCGDRNRPRETNGMSSGHDPEWPGQYVTWRCDGNQWQAISFREVYTPPATPPEHIARKWIEALLRANNLSVLTPSSTGICVIRWSYTITRNQTTVDWGSGAILDRFPFVHASAGSQNDRGAQWVGDTITLRNPDYDSAACREQRLAEARAAALAQRKEEWRVNGVPAPYCEVRTFVPPVPSNSDDLEDSQKQTRYYVAHVIPNAATGELDARTLVNHSGTALHWNGTAEGNLWSSDVYFDQGAVISKLAELSDTTIPEEDRIDCSRTSHDAVIPGSLFTN